ncbi:MAG: SPOR domain-containing protein [Magnetococcales bacterium]|nr:SPOR domain-containing protein [Magnetococcales bacterium]
MTTPRYPTSAKYRRHRSKSYLWPALLGLLTGCGVFLLFQLFFTGDSSSEPDFVPLKVEKFKHLEDVMPAAEEVKPTQVSVPLPPPAPVVKKAPPKPEPLQLSVPLKRKAQEPINYVPIQPESTSSSIQSAVEHFLDPSPSVPAPISAAPSGLSPKSKDPDVKITFYKEFPRRKVVVPKVEEGGGPDGMDAMIRSLVERPAVNRPRPLAPPPGSSLLGVYQVQLVIFSNLERASAVVRELKKQRAPAYLLKAQGSKEPFYRVRLGPFSSQEEAKWAMERWKIRGSSPLILRQRP